MRDNRERIRVLRLHTDDSGRVWYGDDETLGTNSFVDVEDFFTDPDVNIPLSRVRQVVLLGTQANAKLIVQLHNLRQRSTTASVRKLLIFVGSPAICHVDANLRSPSTVLRYLWQSESGLAHRWHALSPDDYATYAMIDSLSNNSVTDKTRHIARQHPAWPALSFIPNLQVDDACQWLASVVDPRWYHHPTRPHRLSRLYRHLGLIPQNVVAMLSGGPPGVNYSTALHAVTSWYNTASINAYMAGECNDPAHFLWRIYGSQDTVVKGVLRATERLVRFVHHYWTCRVSSPHPELAFDPVRFFRGSAEADAFIRHRDLQRSS